MFKATLTNLYNILLLITFFSAFLFISFFPQSSLQSSITESITQKSSSQNLLTYQNDNYGIKIQYHSDWQIEETSNGTTPAIYFFPPNTSTYSPPTFSINIETLKYKNQSLANYLQYSIDSYKEYVTDFKVTSANTNEVLSNYPAYELTFTETDTVDGLQYNTTEIGTVVGSKGYYLTYFADSSSYSTYLPIVNKMISSFEILPSKYPQQMEQTPKSQIEYDAFITLSPEDYWWAIDPINVYVVVDQENNQQSIEYINDAESAVKKWSDLLKQYSGNYKAWNFSTHISFEQLEFDEDGVITNNFDPPADIVLELRDDPTGEECIEAGIEGMIMYLEDPNAGPQYTYSYTSCKDEPYANDYVYSTLLHEFGHALGLGHVYNTKGDLLCGIDEGEGYLGEGNGKSIRTCDTVNERVEPSELDINALLFIYGSDGFKEPNNYLYDKYGDRLYYIYKMDNVSQTVEPFGDSDNFISDNTPTT